MTKTLTPDLLAAFLPKLKELVAAQMAYMVAPPESAEHAGARQRRDAAAASLTDDEQWWAGRFATLLGSAARNAKPRTGLADG
jgi:hypothetical protein